MHEEWIHFCRGRQIDYLCPTEYVLLEFLTGLFEAGASYSSLNSARSAVASILVDQQTSIGEAPLIKKFLRGAFNARPQLPRYTSTWDVNIVLNYLRGVAPSKSLSLKQLTLKTAALLLLLSSHRGQTIMNFKIGSKMELRNNSVCFHIDDLLKTSKPGHHISPISFKAFPADRRLCVVTYLKVYMERTKTLRKCSQLLISYKPPHNAISRDTLSRWTRTVLTLAGVDTSVFKPHSTRAASASAAAKCVPLQTILDAAGWSRASTFSRYYHKSSHRAAASASLADGVLSASLHSK